MTMMMKMIKRKRRKVEKQEEIYTEHTSVSLHTPAISQWKPIAEAYVTALS